VGVASDVDCSEYIIGNVYVHGVIISMSWYEKCCSTIFNRESCYWFAFGTFLDQVLQQVIRSLVTEAICLEIMKRESTYAKLLETVISNELVFYTLVSILNI
jgi:hypothetical protein